MSRSQAGVLPATFACALDALRDGSTAPLALAFSGGLDSTVLLHLAHAYASAHDVPLFAFHVHHGISPNADDWLAHCRAQCEALGVRFDARKVSLQKNKSGVEAAARKLRYAALGALCAEHGVTLMLTAHHLDDQAETVLLQLLRGSGMAGLSGMDAANSAPDLLANADLVMARPLLPVSRQALEDYAAEHALGWIEDESNLDVRYARNALRLQVMPALAAAFPGFQERFARSAAHAQSAQRLLVELAEQDLRAVEVDAFIDVARLRGMSLERVRNLLRHWFGLQNVRMPSSAWLDEMVTQLLEARPGAQILVTHPDCHIRRHRDRLHIVPKLDDLAGMRDPDDEGIIVRHAQRFRWQGEAALHFPDYGGTVHFEQAGRGFDGAWLREQDLQIDFRVGGERLKLAHNRPTRSLKYHYQAVNVPAWERTRLPVVSAGKRLLYAAGIGMDYHHLVDGEGSISLRWQADLAP
ncbi:tRNA lysidine(34) synthetase TilS [Massilia sp. DWR3-1-1]|uniref:tRNA lysidine(34) synthetase TilS n=1 Tax=Massilia sp. DWR3-1-1 TaxID=2804559 RepID=UPI003CEF9D8C